MIVDLTDVTHVGSAAVQVLHDVMAMPGAPLLLRAPVGSVAQQVLELARLPYDTGPIPPIRGTSAARRPPYLPAMGCTG